MVVKWLDEPEAHDFDAAADFLSLVGELNVVDENTDIPCCLVSWQA